jgi:hypothetical protein
MARVYLHEGEYEGNDLRLRRYLETMERPDGLMDQEYQSLQRKAKDFLVRDGYLFKRGRKRGIPPRRVIGRPERRIEAIKELHDETGHNGEKVAWNFNYHSKILF